MPALIHVPTDRDGVRPPAVIAGIEANIDRIENQGRKYFPGVAVDPLQLTQLDRAVIGVFPITARGVDAALPKMFRNRGKSTTP
ncbi:hypothetical protein AZG88_48585 [Rhodococcus sp. LB1]|nr:hypothetical protein AZG88_48585 [Rhodococcus sp. LB1]